MEKFEMSPSLNIENLNINRELFNDLRDLLLVVFNILKININDKIIYYERASDGKSILAIKVLDGDESSKDNYMFVGCNAKYSKDSVTCDVYMHAEAKAGQNCIKISNIISSKLVDFFKNLENDLLEEDLRNIEFSTKIPFVKKVPQLDNSDEPKIKKLFRKMINKIQVKK